MTTRQVSSDAGHYVSSDAGHHIETLRDDELDAVAGGVSSVSEVLKNFGNALQTAARGG
jgi:hypothetical protein